MSNFCSNLKHVLQCSSDCGSGERMREVYCALDSGEELPDSYCNENRRPDERKTCQSDVPCGGKWFTGIWGDVSTNYYLWRGLIEVTKPCAQSRSVILFNSLFLVYGCWLERGP